MNFSVRNNKKRPSASTPGLTIAKAQEERSIQFYVEVTVKPLSEGGYFFFMTKNILVNPEIDN